MPRAPIADEFDAVTRALHWLTALLILTLIPLGLVVSDLAGAIADPATTSSATDIARATWLFSLHKTLGVATFAVALLRIAWALGHTRPGLSHAGRGAEVFLTDTVYWLLYGSLVLVPLSGWLRHAATPGLAPIWGPLGQSLPLVVPDPGLAALFSGLHLVFGRVLIAALALHLAGVAKHQLIDRDATLRRMLRGGSPIPASPFATRVSRGVPPALAALALWAAALTAGVGSGVYGGRATSEAVLAPVASDWQITQGTLGLRVTVLGRDIAGQFDDWRAAITFAPRDTPGAAGTVEVTIAPASLQLGAFGAQATGPDYFDTERFATARFSGRIARDDSGYVVTGPLSIRDITRDITLPFALTLEGTTATASGTLTLDRRDFGIAASLTDEASLGFAVAITWSLSARRATPP